jgi:hypothetical protein
MPSDALEVQLVAIDDRSLWTVLLWAYEQVVKKGADRAILHRAALSTDYRPDPDEVHRLRDAQRRLREAGGNDALIAELETRIEREQGRDRSARHLAALDLRGVRDAGIRWCAVGKRGAPVRITPELIGLLATLFPPESPSATHPLIEGTSDPADPFGDALWSAPDSIEARAYRPPASVREASASLDAVGRPELDAAIDTIVGAEPDGEEIATWLEADFETLTDLYRRAAARGHGIRYLFC